jgi:hypothetical protein
MKVARLNDNILFTFLRDPIVGASASAPDCKPFGPSNHLKKANNHFEKMGYNKAKSKVPNEKGKSKWIASQATKQATVITSLHVNLHQYGISIVWYLYCAVYTTIQAIFVWLFWYIYLGQFSVSYSIEVPTWQPFFCFD